MAVFTALSAFDLRTLDLNLFVREFLSDQFSEDPIDGDSYAVATTGGWTLGAGGPDLTQGGSGVSGLVTFLGLIRGSDEGWRLAQVSVDYSAIDAAMATAGNADDRALFRTLFAGDDHILLSAGDNWMDGFDGADFIIAGKGLDTLNGGADDDTVLGGTAADRISGDGGADLLAGEGGADTLAGGSGTDILIGGKGRDRLAGGGGQDRFHFVGPAEGGDRIADFEDGDAISVVKEGFGGLAVGPLAAGRFVARADNLAQDAGDRFVFRTTDHSLWFDEDGAGASDPTLIATLGNGFALTAAHILVV